MITEKNFLNYCMRNYENVNLVTIEEFQSDINRFIYLSKLFTRYKESGEIRERLVLNHLIVLYNLFGSATTELLYFKICDSNWSVLNTFLSYLNRIEHTDDINLEIMDKLEKI